MADSLKRSFDLVPLPSILTPSISILGFIATCRSSTSTLPKSPIVLGEKQVVDHPLFFSGSPLNNSTGNNHLSKQQTFFDGYIDENLLALINIKGHCVGVLSMFCTGRPKHLWQLADYLLVMVLKGRDDCIHILSRGCSGWGCWSGGLRGLAGLGSLLCFGLWLWLVGLGSLF